MADIVAWHHRVTADETAVGRYTPSVTCIAESSAIAVDPGGSPSDTVLGLVDIDDLAGIRNFPCPDHVRL